MHSLQLKRDCALRYAGFGWPVVPIHSIRDGVCTCRKKANCSCPAKHPRTRHGLKDATIDEAVIMKWWRRSPDPNVAIVTGSASDLVVIDVDADHGGYDSLEAVRHRLGDVPDHPVARTGGGGVHLLFQHPGGRVGSRQRIAEGIDIRADGGYIVAPSSVHASGGVYQWEIDPEKVAPPTLPERWLEWLTAPPCHTDNDREHKTSCGGLGGGGGTL